MKKLIGSIIIIVISFQVVAQLNGTLEVKNVPAPSLANNMYEEPASKEVTIYLPPSYYEVKYAFPVIYFLQGYGCRLDEEIFLGGYEDKLNSGESEEMIIVIIPGCNLLFGSYYVNSIATGNWEDFVRFDVVNYVDNKYRTLVKKQCRAISGHSMGGFGALYVGMRNHEIFNSLYVLAPAIHSDYERFVEVINSGDRIRNCINYIESLYSDTTMSPIGQIKINLISQSLLVQGGLAYGAAFCPDTTEKAPYVKFPYTIDQDNNLIINDSIMDIWYHGAGAWDEKTEIYSDGFSSLDTLIIDHGTADANTYIPHGVQKLASCLNNLNIEHTLLTHPGEHQDYSRYSEHLFPAMSITLTRDSSKYCTGADILSFELDQQIEEAIIDTVNLSVEAYVYDTTNIEYLIPHIEISEGARMLPLNGTEIDFSYGTVYYRVTSGDGNTVKNWAVNVNQRGLGITNLSGNNESIELYPNPTSGIINITGLNQTADVKIYSIQGQLIKSVSQVDEVIDIADLKPGLYILNLRSGKETVLRKIVVER